MRPGPRQRTSWSTVSMPQRENTRCRKWRWTVELSPARLMDKEDARTAEMKTAAFAGHFCLHVKTGVLKARMCGKSAVIFEKSHDFAFNFRNGEIQSKLIRDGSNWPSRDPAREYGTCRKRCFKEGIQHSVLCCYRKIIDFGTAPVTARHQMI